MDTNKNQFLETSGDHPNDPAWQVALRSLLGAAFRLHHYRGAQDKLLRQALIDQEKRIRDTHCCYE